MLLLCVAVAIQVLDKKKEPSIRLLPDPKWETKDPLYATVTEARKYLGTSRQYVHKLIRLGKIRTLNQEFKDSNKEKISLLERAHLYAMFNVKEFLLVEDVIAIKKRQVDNR